MLNLKAIETIYDYFPKTELPLLTEQLIRMQDERPYRDMRLIHNVHLTLSTLCKLHPLIVSGADVTVIVTKNLRCHEQAAKILNQVGIRFINEDQLLNENFDISLDCCAGLLDYIKPSLGAVELTQTGSVKYRQTKLPYPIVSVDDSKLKNVETLLGTGDGFIRSFLELCKENISRQSFVVFGYGKVGKGVIKALTSYTTKITVIEKNKQLIDDALKQGLHVIYVGNHSEVLNCLKDVFCVVTATGINGLISTYFQRSDFSAKYLVNIGSEDEFGNKFSKEDVMFEKKPINFSLIEPTRMRFLDPVFYAHNIGIDIILQRQLGNGLNLFPPDLDLKILNKWLKHFNYDINDVILKNAIS